MAHFQKAIIAAFVGFSLSTAAFGQGGAPQSNQPQAQLTQPGQAPVPGNGMAGPPIDEKTYRQQVGYMIGNEFGKNLRESQVEADMESLLAGIKDALSGAQPKWTEEQLAPVKQRFGQEMQAKGSARMQQAADKNSQAA
ncbi:MAG TPA: FKBP-type peptidyl-prolyl cis-trans isomerase N-terminal domain-containing protein, partial [Pirellulales bacterium]